MDVSTPTIPSVPRHVPQVINIGLKKEGCVFVLILQNFTNYPAKSFHQVGKSDTDERVNNHYLQGMKRK